MSEFAFSVNGNIALVSHNLIVQIPCYTSNNIHYFFYGSILPESKIETVFFHTTETINKCVRVFTFKAGEYFLQRHTTKDKFTMLPSYDILHIRTKYVSGATTLIVSQLLVRLQYFLIFLSVILYQHLS